MAIIKCPNGHWYESDQYNFCPHCSNEYVSIDRTVPMNLFTKEHTLPLDDDRTLAKYPTNDDELTQMLGNDDDERTVAAYSAQKTGIDHVVGWLVCVYGPEKGRDYRLFMEQNTIGRSPDNRVCIADDPHISKMQHASVTYDPQGRAFYIIPGSSTETTLNGQPLISYMPLKDGDMLTMGSSGFCFIAFCKGDITW